MADVSNAKNFKSTNEVLDLRTSAPKPADSQTLNQERPAQLEQKEAFEQPSNVLEKPGLAGEMLLPKTNGGIIAAGQNRALNDERFHQIENALADGLENLYLSMDLATQARFKSSGEDASRSINDLILKGKCTLKKVLDIIKNWLYLIPSVNKFFLEQEAKIRADKIMNIQRKYGEKNL